ncbi:hypothetical protein LUZ60_016000 [Juncus effusus]|nr:hypothetical protein LUZ60_016000 [Juncus effusus]
MVGVLSNKIGKDELKPGDHIYSWRSAYIYAHHGIYTGDEQVIHFTLGREIGTSTSPTSTHNCPACSDLQLSHNPNQRGARDGTCTFAQSDPPDLVIHRAEYLLKNEFGFGTYSLFKHNCQDFAIYCKTGLLVETAFSVNAAVSAVASSLVTAVISVVASRRRRLASVKAAISAVASSPLTFLPGPLLSGLAVPIGMYCLQRYMSDIGIRTDVVKLPVESLFEHVGEARASDEVRL